MQRKLEKNPAAVRQANCLAHRCRYLVKSKASGWKTRPLTPVPRCRPGSTHRGFHPDPPGIVRTSRDHNTCHPKVPHRSEARGIGRLVSFTDTGLIPCGNEASPGPAGAVNQRQLLERKGRIVLQRTPRVLQSPLIIEIVLGRILHALVRPRPRTRNPGILEVPLCRQFEPAEGIPDHA